MASRVQGCLSSATFGGEPLLSYRGIKPEDYIFSDENHLTKFLSLSEESNAQYSPMTYEVDSSNKLVQDLHYMWNVPVEFSGSYFLSTNIQCTYKQEDILTREICGSILFAIRICHKKVRVATTA